VSIVRRTLGSKGHRHKSILGIDKGKTVVNPSPAVVNAEIDSMSIEATIAEYRRFAVGVLTELGLPSDWPSLLGHFDDNELSPEWYARKILFWAQSLEGHLANQNAKETAFAALRLQSAVERFRISQIEHAAIVGALIIKPKYIKYSDADKLEWERLYKALMVTKFRPAARDIAELTGDDSESIRKHLAKLGKK